MIVPQRARPATVSLRPWRIARSRPSVRRHPAWQTFLDDRRALRLKWGLLVLLLVIAALLDVPL